MTANYFRRCWSAIRSDSNHHLDRSFDTRRAGQFRILRYNPAQNFASSSNFLRTNVALGRSEPSTQAPATANKRCIAFGTITSGGRRLIMASSLRAKTEFYWRETNRPDDSFRPVERSTRWDRGKGRTCICGFSDFRKTTIRRVPLHHQPSILCGPCCTITADVQCPFWARGHSLSAKEAGPWAIREATRPSSCQNRSLRPRGTSNDKP
jgi:hypothetical protein